ncbi:DUF3373 family protein [Halobacteriovorax sp. GB3]|uniref:DUF3373 family protein n=1 Tax=Halobacteriovorax sp. GB3 TaxID=2719615 RepID=UPI00236005F4|nr:DUF3373 family protein [Halobacteriovorax sp. GB3]MDD0853792.1 DUF3373 family protein [Halobacteriovorax sp. GB3]
MINKKNITTLLLAGTLAAPAFAATTAELEERIEELEFANDSRFFNWTGTLENRYDYTTSEEKTTGSEASGNQSYFHSQFHLDMESRPSEKLSFFGRLSMKKYWNDGSFDANKPTSTENGDARNSDGLFDTWGYGRDHGTAAVYVERAFVNYDMGMNLTYTIGRLPTIDGMPKHINSGSPALGSYPTLAFSAILDGMALTHNAAVAGGSLKTRLIYTPLQFANFDGGTTTGRGIDNTTDLSGVTISTNSPMYSFMLDYTKNNTSFANGMNLIFQWVKIDNVFFGSSSTSALRLTNNRFAFYAEATGVAGTGLDFAAQFAMSKSESEGKLGGAQGVYCNDSKCDEDGNSYVLTAKYNFSKFALGYEYIKHEENSFAYDVANRGPLNIYGTAASNTHHIFANYKVDNNMKFVFGYQVQDIDQVYNYGLFGKGTDVDIKRDNFYTRMIATF